MDRIKIINLSKSNIIAEQGLFANSFWNRLNGLIGKKQFDENEAMCIKPCKSVHMFFMRFSIDVVFVDNDNVVIKEITSLKPWQISPYVKQASYVIELPKGTISDKDINIGDKIDIEKY